MTGRDRLIHVRRDRLIRVGLDTVPYRQKPDNPTTGAITNRMKRTGFVEVPLWTFFKAVMGGCTWTPGAFEPTDKPKGWGAFVSAELIGLDFDNKRRLPDGNEEKFLIGDPRCMLPEAVNERLRANGLSALCAYCTGSAKKEHPRFRVVIDLEEPIADLATYERIVAGVLRLFPEADQGCEHANRLFFGCCGVLRDVWVRPDAL